MLCLSPSVRGAPLFLYSDTLPLSACTLLWNIAVVYVYCFCGNFPIKYGGNVRSRLVNLNGGACIENVPSRTIGARINEGSWYRKRRGRASRCAEGGRKAARPSINEKIGDRLVKGGSGHAKLRDVRPGGDPRTRGTSRPPLVRGRFDRAGRRAPERHPLACLRCRVRLCEGRFGPMTHRRAERASARKRSSISDHR